MQKIIVAPDSFKGSICAIDAAHAIARGLKSGACNAPDIVCVPIADGGEGTLAAIVPKDQWYSLRVCGPDGSKVEAHYGHKDDVAVIEMAEAAGLTLIDEKSRSAMKTTGYGVGELINDALDKGYRRILLTVGGSATNDGGAGMMAALGVQFFNAQGQKFIPVGGTLINISHIDISRLDKRLQTCEIRIATDVKNPLVGDLGATNAYARQKGASDDEIAAMEKGMQWYAGQIKALSDKDMTFAEGCGAGGGLPFPLLSLCNAQICSGIDAVLQTVSFETALENASMVITGEGCLDVQSFYGKAVSGVIKAAKARHVPVFCFSGCTGAAKDELISLGMEEIYTLMEIAPSREYAMTHADAWLEELARRFACEKGL